MNPLKKDNNTDALVKALEDANGTGADPATAVDPAVATPDPSALPETPGFDPSAATNDPVANTAPAITIPDVEESAPPVDTAQATDVADPVLAADPTAGLTFDGNDLPAGLSADATTAPTVEAEPVVEQTPPAPVDTSNTGEIDEVKRSALEQLRPLIEKLELEPSDKFDKYLMMLRASDDPVLIKPAFDAAQGIPGEKEKAQALLDIINEINYITASQQQTAA